MGDEFVRGYIALADGEKDPRNLLLAFSIDKVICIEFDITQHIEVTSVVIYLVFFFTKNILC